MRLKDIKQIAKLDLDSPFYSKHFMKSQWKPK